VLFRSADVDKVKSTIETAKVLTSMGFISTDKRTSSVIIKDVKEKHKEYAALIKSLDQATPQVSIEARLVEVTTSFSKELGIQWGALWKPPDSRMTIGGTGIPGGTGFSNAKPLMVNLPASVSSGSGGAIGLGYITASSVFALDLQLSAMESSGQGKIISNPKITTMDNQKATIKQGRKIPYSTTSSEGTKTEFVDANLELTVTPHITPEGTIVMDVDAKKNEADFAQTSGGVPTIDTKEATTQVLVKDGDTLVIGGIFKTTKSTSDAGVPFFSKIPLLGWLFKKEADTDNTSELLIFITPRVLK
jgi:type IV pilus assembly protein PilQ